MNPAKQPDLMPAEPLALQKADPQGADAMTAMIERLASNKDVDVEKLERILAMQERVLRQQAEAEFNAAFAEMQAEIPTIIERGKTDKGTYARLEDIIKQVRPVLQKFGFSLSHRTEWPDPKTVKVFGILTHRAGHSRQSEFLSSADQSGSKNAIQALGSAVSYGRRYTTKDLLNIATTDEDDDGRAAGRRVDPEAAKPPQGYDDWQSDMESCADEGWPKLSAAFGKSPDEYRKRATGIDKAWWTATKSKAEKVKATK